MRKVLVTLALAATAVLGLGGVANAATTTKVIAFTLAKGQVQTGTYACPAGSRLTSSNSVSSGAAVIEYPINGVYNYRVTGLRNGATFKATLVCK